MQICEKMVSFVSGSCAHLGVDPGGRELVLEHHDDDAEHSHDERVVADALPLLEEGLAPPQPVRKAVAVRVVVGPERRISKRHDTMAVCVCGL